MLPRSLMLDLTLLWISLIYGKGPRLVLRVLVDKTLCYSHRIDKSLKSVTLGAISHRTSFFT